MSKVPDKVLTVYEYQQNSCYLDTLLLILFDNLSKKWINAMILTSYRESDFKSLVCGKKLDPKQTIEYGGRVRQILVDEYNKIHSESPSFLICNDIRSILLECIPNLKENGKYVPYNIGEIYNLFVSLYPGLNINIPYIIKTGDRIMPKEIMSLPSFTMWDFMEDSTEGKIYLWEELDSDIIVFQNTGVPVIKNLGSLEPEKSIIKLGDQEYEENIIKKRIFSETILNEKYRLVGAIILQGYLPGKESGIHYVGYFVDPAGKYYFYNDIGPKLILLQEFPDTIWRYDNYNMPIMYFYAKTH